MGVITLHTDLEQHYLQHEFDDAITLIEEPKGWKESNKTISRSKTSGEIISKNAKDVVFIGKGREYILNAEALYGTNVTIMYSIRRRNPKNVKDIFFDNYFVDLISMKDKNAELSVKVDEGGLSKKLISKESVKVELETEVSMNGEPITPLEYKRLELEGRNIFLRSILEHDYQKEEENSGEEEIIELTARSVRKIYVYDLVALPVEVVADSHQGKVRTIYYYPADRITVSANSNSIIDVGSRGNDNTINLCFYTLSDQDNKQVEVEVDYSFFVERRNSPINPKYETDGIVQLHLTVFSKDDDDNFTIKEQHVLDDLKNYRAYTDENPIRPGEPPIKMEGKTHTVLEPLDLNDSVSVHLVAGAKLGAGQLFNKRGRWYWDITKSKTTIKFSEHSNYPKSTTKVIQGLEFMDRHLEIITGKKGVVYSAALGRKGEGYNNDGAASILAVSNGTLIRQFELSEDKKLSSSFKDAMVSINAMFGLDYMIEKTGAQERVRIEPLSFFYVPQVTITLPYVVQDLEITKAKEFMYDSYEFGYEKGGDDYEEATGIREYNGKIEYYNILEIENDKKLTKLSKIRGDSSGIEFARRKPQKAFPDEDTRYDNDLFAFMTKKGITDVLQERKWADDFDEEPTGIYSPETATNLLISPARMRQRRAFWIAGSLHQYLDSYIRYASANCNSNLETIKDGVALKENEDIKVSDYGKSLLTMYWAKFTHKVDFELSKQLRGKTIRNRKEFYNFFGIIEFKTADNITKYGWLFEVKENGKGEFKVLLANI